MQETPVQFLGWEDHWRRDRLPTPVILGFPCGSAGKESTCNVEDLGSIPGLGRSPGEGKVYPLQYSGLENSMDCIVHGATNSRTRLSDFHFTSLHIHYPLSFYSNNCVCVAMGIGGPQLTQFKITTVIYLLSLT